MTEPLNDSMSRREMVSKTALAGLGTLALTSLGPEEAAAQRRSAATAASTAPGSRTSDYFGKITPQNTAVLLIDYQTNLLLGCQSMEQKKLINNVLALGTIAKMYNLPVVITTTGGAEKGPAGPTLPALTAMFPDVKQHDRQLFYNSMSDPAFNAAVKATGRKKLIVGGITTDLCVVFPVITAIQQGYDVYVVGDACASWDEQINTLAMTRIVQAGGIPVNVQALVAELQNNLAETDPAAAKANIPKEIAFYGQYVGVTSLLNDTFFKK
ncbi:isochorismatase family protein [Hymenobacter terrenus]|uniref:isochorismatase family protein n=1 Tax=Hymenobacter terrenus TaxID=1629124 RepID=UPI00069639E4|nr:isochorismatase family protein [Hymenobacter terrenus]